MVSLTVPVTGLMASLTVPVTGLMVSLTVIRLMCYQIVTSFAVYGLLKFYLHSNQKFFFNKLSLTKDHSVRSNNLQIINSTRKITQEQRTWGTFCDISMDAR